MKRKRTYKLKKTIQINAASVTKPEPEPSTSHTPLHKPVYDNRRTEENRETGTQITGTIMKNRQADSEVGQNDNGRMEINTNALGQMIATIIKEISKEAGGLANLSRSLVVDNSISNAHTRQPCVNMEPEENKNQLQQNPELKAALEVIKNTMELDAADPFNRPVDPVAFGIPDYFDVINTPMDFGTICNNLENGLKYMYSAEVFKDVQWIWYNCIKYNKKGDHILELMKRVKTYFIKHWKASGLHTDSSPPLVDSANNQKKHQVRGPTRGLKLLTTVGRIKIATNELGQPVGPEATQLTSFLGLTARDGNLAPLTYPSWSKMPKEKKENIWEEVLSRFDIDPSCRKWVMLSLRSKWRNFKFYLKASRYDTHATDEERLADRDERVPPDQWSFLVSQWSSDKWRSLSARNKAKRAKVRFNHTAGTKSFARVLEEERAKRPDGQEPSQAELFILTRTHKNGEPVNEATAAVISQLRASTTQDDIPSLCVINAISSLPRTMIPSRADSLKMVKEKNAEVLEMKERLASVEQTCSRMAAQMSAMMSMMATFQNGSSAKYCPNSGAENKVPVGVPNQAEPTLTSNHEVCPKQTRGRKRRRIISRLWGRRSLCSAPNGKIWYVKKWCTK